jgi:hypothetical protein
MVGSPRERRTVASAIVPGQARGEVRHDLPASERLIGTLVHRMLDRHGVGVDLTADEEQLQSLATQLLRPAEYGDLEHPDAFVRRVVQLYRHYAVHPDVCALYSSGRRLHEVPFTMSHGDALVRGAIDCLVVTSSAAGAEEVTVLEFKTGRPRPEHEAQLELYRNAVSLLFPGAGVRARLVYSGTAVSDAATNGVEPQS